MTVINNIEIDNIEYSTNEIKDAIRNNDPIEPKLHVIIVLSNPIQFARRYILAKEFMKRFEMEEENAILYVVELAYKEQKFRITDPHNPHHLQLRTNEAPLWCKENLINIGVRKLLPKNWKTFAFVDADIEFLNPHWTLDALKILNGTKDILSLYSHCLDMDKNKKTMNNFSSFGYQYTMKNQHNNKGLDYWHPGYGIAFTRKAYEKLKNGVYEDAILGSGDNIFFMSYIKNGLKALDPKSTDGYKQSVLKYQDSMKGLRLGYVPGVIRHHFHGSKVNRQYVSRWQVLVKHNYDPNIHIKKDENGLLIPSKECPRQLLDDIYKYFEERNEDEGYTEAQ